VDLREDVHRELAAIVALGPAVGVALAAPTVRAADEAAEFRVSRRFGRRDVRPFAAKEGGGRSGAARPHRLEEGRNVAAARVAAGGAPLDIDIVRPRLARP